jgi:broad specificity phosphatase PhoE
VGLHLVRHAKAGSRSEWGRQPDELRPLTAAGEAQALALADRLGDVGVKRILSSRYLRCVQTVAPLAERLGLDVEQHPALAEEADLADTWVLLREAAGWAHDVVLVSHGNVIGEVVERLDRRGVAIAGDQPGCAKGSVWTLATDAAGEIVEARYTRPPR